MFYPNSILFLTNEEIKCLKNSSKFIDYKFKQSRNVTASSLPNEERKCYQEKKDKKKNVNNFNKHKLIKVPKIITVLLN